MGTASFRANTSCCRCESSACRSRKDDSDYFGVEKVSETYPFDEARGHLKDSADVKLMCSSGVGNDILHATEQRISTGSIIPALPVLDASSKMDPHPSPSLVDTCATSDNGHTPPASSLAGGTPRKEEAYATLGSDYATAGDHSTGGTAMAGDHTPRMETRENEGAQGSRPRRPILDRRKSFLNEMGTVESSAMKYSISNKREIHDQYHIQGLVRASVNSLLKKGIMKATVKATGAKRAVKAIEKTQSPERRHQTAKEIDIWRTLDHPNIVLLREIFEDERCVFMVFEHCSGGTLQAQLDSVSTLREVQAAVVMQQVLRAVLYLHKNLICHRDLRPKHVMIVHSEQNETEKAIDVSTLVKVSGFASSCKFMPGTRKRMSQVRGLESHRAPEIISKSYTHACDLWSCGVMMHQMLCGELPVLATAREKSPRSVDAGEKSLKSPRGAEKSPRFSSSSPRGAEKSPRFSTGGDQSPRSMPELEDLAARVKQAVSELEEQTPRLHEPGDKSPRLVVKSKSRKKAGTPTVSVVRGSLWEDMSKGARDLLGWLLEADVEHRYTAEQALQHKWLERAVPKLAYVPLSAELVQNLKEYRSLNQLKRAVLMVVAGMLSQSETSIPRKIFHLTDVNGDGTINMSEMLVQLRTVPNLRVEGDIEHMFAQSSSTNVGKKEFGYTEFLAASFDRKRCLREDVLRSAFKCFDEDGDGFISFSELGAFYLLEGLSLEELGEVMSYVDRNQDNRIDFEEFLTLMLDDDVITGS